MVLVPLPVVVVVLALAGQGRETPIFVDTLPANNVPNEDEDEEAGGWVVGVGWNLKDGVMMMMMIESLSWMARNIK